MGSSGKKSGSEVSNNALPNHADSNNNNGWQNSQSVISVETIELKEKLNQVFVHMHDGHSHRQNKAGSTSFDRLWDLKEMAILEGRNTIDLPSQWLAELEQTVNQCSQVDIARKH